MSRRIVISRAHRDALYSELITDFDALDDLSKEYLNSAPDLETCELVGRRVVDSLRLIQDGGLGWDLGGGENSGDGLVELTLPAEELRRAILSKRGMLAGYLQVRQPEREATEREWEQQDMAHEACNSILDQLAAGGARGAGFPDRSESLRSFGRAAALREEQEMLVTELARRSGIGEEEIRAIESGDSDPYLATIEALARALGTTPADLIRRGSQLEEAKGRSGGR